MNPKFQELCISVDNLITQLPDDATLCFNIAPGVTAIICNDGEYRAKGDWAEMAFALLANQPMGKWKVDHV